jgi:K+-sensing histidine kinase KdpD
MTNHSSKAETGAGLRTLFAGALLCGGAAVATSAVASGHAWQAWAPLMFSAVLLLVALCYGMRAGILGTLLAGLIFAVFLFEPRGTYHVGNGAARANLAWMLLIGIAFSFLFAPPTSGFRQR